MEAYGESRSEAQRTLYWFLVYLTVIMNDGFWKGVQEND
jgi:hypothetical protein